METLLKREKIIVLLLESYFERFLFYFSNKLLQFLFFNLFWRENNPCSISSTETTHFMKSTILLLQN